VSALKKVNLDIFEGEYTALVGASGSGKSTLLNIIGCIDDPDSGEVLIDNVNIKNLTDDQKSDLRNQKIGFIFQSFNLVPVLNVFENIELPLQINPLIPTAKRRDRVREAIADVGLENFAHHRPDQLSGGQRQRVAIARALVGHPLLVLADEPTANLDSETSNKILDLMSDLNQKKKVTFLFSTHDEKIMNRVGRIVHIKDGVIHP
jgi:putative ABC transport system ATP-binding protein